jgi:hypothetical protein
MKILKQAAAFTISLAAAVAAFSQNIKITGSPEFQQAAYAAIVSSLANPQIACLGGRTDGSDMSGATDAVITGTYNGQPQVIQVSWSSSYTGLQTIATSGTMSWLSPSNIPSVGSPVYAQLNSGTITGYTLISPGSQIYDAPTSAPNVTLSDQFQGTSPFTGSSYPVLVQDTNPVAGYSGTPLGVGVLPFFWAKGNSTSVSDYANLTNITPLQAQLLLESGELPLSVFTGNAADSGTDVILVGRAPVAGIRAEVEADAGYGFGEGTENQYQPVIAGGLVVGVTNVGNAGFAQGSGVATALATPQNGGVVDDKGRPFILVGYLDSNDLHTVTATVPGAQLAYAGVAYSSVPQIGQGQYSLWSYEHMYFNGLSSTQQTLANVISGKLSAIIGNGSSFGANGINLSNMDYLRVAEGSVIVPLPVTTPPPPPPAYTYYATHFTGGAFPSKTSLELGGDFHNTNNTTYVGSMNFWIRLPNVVAPFANNTFDVFEVGVNEVHVWLRDGVGADVGKIYVEIAVYGTDGSPGFISRTSAHTQADGWLHVQASWNLKSPGQTSCLYVNDVSDNHLQSTLGYHPCRYVAVSPVQVSFGADPRVPGPGEYAAAFDISEFWFSETQYVDFTSAATRALFEAPGGHPGNLASDGSGPTGSPPILYFRNPYNSFGTNSGTGGSFTFYGTGALIPATTAP